MLRCVLELDAGGIIIVVNKTLLIGIVLLLIFAAGGWMLFGNNSVKQQSATPTPTNAQALQTDNSTPIITESNVTYFPQAKGYFARPEAEGKYPGVVMIHENRGLRPEIRQTADNLAKEGYMVLAVDLYKGQVVEKQEDARAISGSFNQQEGTENLKAAVAYLREKGATKIASLGWCFGGRQSVALAISGETLDATVVYYGGNMASTVDELRPIKWPVLGIFGDKDQAIPVAKVKEFEASLNTLGVENEIHIYPEVGHAFANPSGANYAPEETKDAWMKTTAFLKKYLQN
jgi:carboxymethylenebutenolidase